jgi:hypothetical protein
MATSSTPLKKNRYIVTTLLFLALFLFVIFLFSKRALEPTLFVYRYRDLFSQPPSLSSSRTDSNLSVAFVSTHAVSPPEPLHPPAPSPISPISQKNSSESINGELSVEDGKDPVQKNASFGTMNGNGGDLYLEGVQECDLYMGTWVKDEGYPIYKPGSCPYVDEAFDCQNNGRGDSDYLKWRWKPDGCDLPRYVFFVYPFFNSGAKFRWSCRFFFFLDVSVSIFIKSTIPLYNSAINQQKTYLCFMVKYPCRSSVYLHG